MPAGPGANVLRDFSGVEIRPAPPPGHVSRETEARLEAYRVLLVRWQARTNLVAPDTLEQFRIRHVEDSLQVVDLAADARNWVDLGSGAGFPGMVIAIAQAGARTRTGAQTGARTGQSGKAGSRHVLVEANARKCAFLREVARATATEVEIVNERIESAAERLIATKLPQIVTARALGPLPRLLPLLAPFLAAGATAMIHKGRNWRGEIEECDGLDSLDLVIHASRVETGSVILELAGKQ